MVTPMPTAPEPGPGQAVIRVRWTETVERVADVVINVAERPSSAQVDGWDALWDVAAERGVHPITGERLTPIVVATGRRMHDALLMAHTPPTTTTPEEG